MALGIARLMTVTLAFGAGSAAAAWSQVPSVGPNAVGVHVARAGYDPSAPAAGPDEVGVDDAFGVRFSYGRRIAGGRKLWLGPEVVGGWIGESSLSAANPAYPSGVSRTFAVALMRANLLGADEGSFYESFGLGIGAGFAFGRFAEGQRLLDGSANPNPRTDTAIGPALAFGLDFRITRHVILRADGYFLFLKPELSFPWPDQAKDKAIAGGGLVIVF
jgi:hypothetical protein